LTTFKGVVQKLSGRESPILRDLFWAKDVVTARRIKARDIDPLQKIFFIFLNRFLMIINDSYALSCGLQTEERAFSFQ
jgi:hypothetical protein